MYMNPTIRSGRQAQKIMIPALPPEPVPGARLPRQQRQGTCVRKAPCLKPPSSRSPRCTARGITGKSRFFPYP
eukprot:3159824-Rhodomonas_salina.1